jgi:general stress protein 26
MAHEEQLNRVWEIIERVGVCMLTTRFAAGLRARPLEARPDRDHGRIWFVTNLHSGKEQEIESEDDVGLVFIDAREKAYLSITARAQVLRDHAKAAAIWKSTDNVWWRGPDEQGRRRVRIRQGAAYWRQAQSRREPQGDGQSTVMPRLLLSAEDRCAAELKAQLEEQRCSILRGVPHILDQRLRR